MLVNNIIDFCTKLTSWTLLPLMIMVRDFRRIGPFGIITALLDFNSKKVSQNLQKMRENNFFQALSTLSIMIIGGMFVTALMDQFKDSDASKKLDEKAQKEQASKSSLQGLALGSIVAIGIWIAKIFSENKFSFSQAFSSLFVLCTGGMFIGLSIKKQSVKDATPVTDIDKSNEELASYAFDGLSLGFLATVGVYTTKYLLEQNKSLELGKGS